MGVPRGHSLTGRVRTHLVSLDRSLQECHVDILSLAGSGHTLCHWTGPCGSATWTFSDWPGQDAPCVTRQVLAGVPH